MMVRSKGPVAALVLMALLGAATSGLAAGFGKRSGEVATAPVLSDAERATLVFMREEEKLARDVYLTLYGIHGHQVFANIMESEQRHFDAIGGLIAKYGVDDPATPEVHGVFRDPTLQALYDQLAATGARSLLDGLKVGGFIEETDLSDLANAVDESDQSDLDQVYTNLLEGSKNHLRAFVSAIEKIGEDYEAQHLSETELEAILNAERRFGGR